MANGKVTTGFSYPYVALYSAAGTVITYSSGQALARGVNVTLSPESSSDNIFYADNRQAENAGGKITGYTLSLTVDGLKEAAERLITGLPAAVSGWTAVGGDSQAVPYCGVGWITRYIVVIALEADLDVVRAVFVHHPGNAHVIQQRLLLFLGHSAKRLAPFSGSGTLREILDVLPELVSENGGALVQ